jgi:hypothetical protein
LFAVARHDCRSFLNLKETLAAKCRIAFGRMICCGQHWFENEHSIANDNIGLPE